MVGIGPIFPLCNTISFVIFKNLHKPYIINVTSQKKILSSLWKNDSSIINEKSNIACYIFMNEGYIKGNIKTFFFKILRRNKHFSYFELGTT